MSWCSQSCDSVWPSCAFSRSSSLRRLPSASALKTASVSRVMSWAGSYAGNYLHVKPRPIRGGIVMKDAAGCVGAVPRRMETGDGRADRVRGRYGVEIASHRRGGLAAFGADVFLHVRLSPRRHHRTASAGVQRRGGLRALPRSAIRRGNAVGALRPTRFRPRRVVLQTSVLNAYLFSILIDLSSMRVFGVSPSRGVCSIASTTFMPSTT